MTSGAMRQVFGQRRHDLLQHRRRVLLDGARRQAVDDDERDIVAAPR